MLKFKHQQQLSDEEEQRVVSTPATLHHSSHFCLDQAFLLPSSCFCLFENSATSTVLFRATTSMSIILDLKTLPTAAEQLIIAVTNSGSASVMAQSCNN